MGMTLSPARTMKLPMSTEMSRLVGDRLVATQAHPDTTAAFDLRTWPLAGRAVPGFFATSLAALNDGRCLAVGRHHHPNPYRLYDLDVVSGVVTSLPCESSWPDLRSVRAIGDRVLLVPGGTLGREGSGPAWWRDGALTPLDLPPPPEPETFEHDGKRYATSRRVDGFDVAPLPGGEALVLWFEGLYRASAEGVVPLSDDRFPAAWEPLREGRYDRLDDQGSALMLLNRRLVAVARDGTWSHAAPGAEALTGLSAGPDGTWLLVGDETLSVVSPKERWVIEVDLRPMRLAPKMPLFLPKALWVPSRGAVLVTNAHDAWEFDLAALLAEKRVPMEKHAAKLVAARRSEWKRKLKGAGAPVAIDALSPLTRGGGAVTHPTWGEGAVLHASEMLHRGTRCIAATVLFEDRPRAFDYVGGRWVEQARAVA
jgi:hypothetical protein